MISSLDNHLEALYHLRRFGIKLGLETISRLMRGLGNPHHAYCCIYVAGTNGKGSIAALLSSILTHAGYKVGLYTSPHLVRFNERIQINGHPISDRHVIEAAEAVQQIYTQSDPPTFFECATAMALYYFGRQNVEWAVLETGMGGRYDATNVVRPKVCVISNISKEHTEYLGNTLIKIAAEKAGIIKSGAGVVTGVRQKNALGVIEQTALEKGAPLLRLGKEIKVRNSRNGSFTYMGKNRYWRGLKVGLPGTHQIQNAGLVLGAVEFLAENDLKVSDKAIHAGLRAVLWPGRLGIISANPLVILDGAHNPSAVETLKRFLQKEVARRRLTIVIGILKDKAWKVMLRKLAGISDRIILTSPQYERAGDPEQQANFVRSLNQDVLVIPRIPDAVSFAIDRATKNDAVCITGSLYTVGEAKAYLDSAHP